MPKSPYYPETRYVVCTDPAPPEGETLSPVAQAPVEQGCFNTPEAAADAALPFLKAGQSVQVYKRHWVEINEPFVWYNAAHYKRD